MLIFRCGQNESDQVQKDRTDQAEETTTELENQVQEKGEVETGRKRRRRQSTSPVPGNCYRHVS